MILELIQGCRYLRRLMDRWLLSKNSTTRLKGLESWHGAGLLWNCSMPITNTKGLYLYPVSNTTPCWLRLQHWLSKTYNMSSCQFRTHHQFISFFISSPRHHVSSNVSSFNYGTTLCQMMTHSRPHTPLTECVESNSCRMVLSFQSRPTCQFSPVPIFGVNSGCNGR
jgi:hypothetical protein